MGGKGLLGGSESGDKFLMGHVSKLVNSHGKGVEAKGFLSIVLGNSLQVVGKDGLSLLML